MPTCPPREASSKAREAARHRRIAELELDNAALHDCLRKRPRLPERPAVLRPEQDRHTLFELAACPGTSPSARDTCCGTCARECSGADRYPCRCWRSVILVVRSACARNAVTVPTGTTAVTRDAFVDRGWRRSAGHGRRDCGGDVRQGGLQRMQVLERDLPPNLTDIGEWAISGCTSLGEVCRPPSPRLEGAPFTNARPRDHAATQTHRDWRERLLRVHVLERDLPPTLTETGKYACCGCTSLREVCHPTSPRLESMPSPNARP